MGTGSLGTDDGTLWRSSRDFDEIVGDPHDEGVDIPWDSLDVISSCVEMLSLFVDPEIDPSVDEDGPCSLSSIGSSSTVIFTTQTGHLMQSKTNTNGTHNTVC